MCEWLRRERESPSWSVVVLVMGAVRSVREERLIALLSQRSVIYDKASHSFHGVLPSLDAGTVIAVSSLSPDTRSSAASLRTLLQLDPDPSPEACKRLRLVCSRLVEKETRIKKLSGDLGAFYKEHVFIEGITEKKKKIACCDKVFFLKLSGLVISFEV